MEKDYGIIYAELCAKHQQLQAALSATVEQRDRLLEALKSIEWSDYSDPDYGRQFFCQECRNDKQHGHMEGCTIADAIASIERQEGEGK